MSVGLLAAGSYVPPARLPVAAVRSHWAGVAGPAGVRRVSVAGWDEDVVTMAVEAADLVPLDDVDALYLATCSSPYAEHSAAAEVARALGLDAAVAVADFAGSTLGGVAALAAAADAVAAGRVRRVLVVAAERRRGEPGTAVEALGAGAVALVVGREAPVALGGGAARRHGVPTRWRPDGAVALRHYDDARYELNEQILPAVRALLGTSRPAFVAIGPLDGRGLAALGVGGAAGTSGGEVADIGDLGAAAPLLSLLSCIEHSAVGDEGVCVAVEPGSGAQSLDVVVAAPLPVVARRGDPYEIDYVEFLRRFGALSGPAPPEPIVPWSATPGALRDDQVGSLSGARCRRCSALNVPPRPLCIECSAGPDDLVLERAPRCGSVVTYNAQHMAAVDPEPAPMAVGVIRLDGEPSSRGGQVSAMFCDTPLDRLRVGAEVELVYRRLGRDNGLVKYGWKARLR